MQRTREREDSEQLQLREGSELPKDASWRNWSPTSLVPPLDLALALALGLGAVIAYGVAGYSLPMLWVWVAGVVALAISFRAYRVVTPPAIPRVDLAISGALMAAFAPLYLIALHTVPVQVNSDEIVIMNAMVTNSTGKHDPFGPSSYFGHPTIVFLLFGKVERLLGGVSLYHTRLLHGLLGLAVIGTAYLLLRQLLPRPWAVFATVIVGANHSLLMISRMAMREDSAVLAELAAFALLVRGLRHDEPLATYLGGLAAGVGFYTYFPGRAAVVLWGAFLVMVAVWFRRAVPLGKLVRLGAIAAAGFLVIAGPIVADQLQQSPSAQREQRVAVLIYPEARRLQASWDGGSSVVGGIAKNVEYGLTSFNSTVADHGWIYVNGHHGFVDPITGVLLWIGAGVALLSLRRRRDDPWPLVALGSFVILWLAFALVFTKAPDYTRLLITLPFVGYLAAVAARALAARVSRSLREAGAGWTARGAVAVVVALLVSIVAWNLVIARDYVRYGQRVGDVYGSTGRYLEARSGVPGEKFYLVADNQKWSYYPWGPASGWTYWMDFFAKPGQVQPVMPPAQLAGFAAPPPFSLLMVRSLWQQDQSLIRGRFPQAQVRDVTPNGALVAVDVPRSLTG